MRLCYRERSSSQGIKIFYRLDYRPPAIILSKGFEGTNTAWLNNIFDNHSVFASKSLRGISRFFLESVMNKNVDGSDSPGALSSFRYLYPPEKKCYVYKINATSLETLDVAEDLRLVMSQRETSRLYLYKKSRLSSQDAEDLDIHLDLAIRLSHYSYIVKHTEEVIIRGPISPSRITLYQTL